MSALSSHAVHLRRGCWSRTLTGHHALQLDAMNLGTLLPEMPQLLSDMGVSYDPHRLAAVLGRRRLAINLRALRIAATLGGFITSLAKVRSSAGAGVSSRTSAMFALQSICTRCQCKMTRELKSRWHLNSMVHVGWQDYATGAFEANMNRRATELQGILARLGPSFAKVGIHCSLHCCAAVCSRLAHRLAGHPNAARHVDRTPCSGTHRWVRRCQHGRTCCQSRTWRRCRSCRTSCRPSTPPQRSL